jgi:hypothetical protein
MPYMTNGERDYDKQRKYDGKESVKKDRAARNAARAKMKANGVDVAGKDVDHKRPLSKNGNNDTSNLRAVKPSTNRSFARKKNGAMK